MSTINYTYNVIVDRFRQFSDGHFQLRRFTHGEISQADLEKEAEWPWMHVKPRAINYSPGTRAFSFEVFISDLPRDKEDKTGYQAESITDCSLIFQDLINEIYLGNMFGSDVLLTRPVNSEPFVEQYTHTLTGVTGIIELSLDYDWSACSIPASWNYNTPTNSPNDGFGALQFIESLHQDGVFVSLDNDEEAPGNSYYYGTDASGVKGWYAIVDNIGLTCETLPDCAVIISIVDDIATLQGEMLLKANIADLGLVAFSNSYNDLDNLPTIPTATSDLTNDGADGVNPFITAADVPAQVNSDWNATSGVAEILNKPTLTSGTVTSVGLTMPSAFSVANSPITSSGDIAVTGAGTVSQYVRGDGSLANFPSSTGGGSSLTFYLNGSVAQGTFGGVAFKEMDRTPIFGAGTDFTIATNGYIQSFITDANVPNLLEIPAGNWNFETYFSASSNGGNPSFYIELYKWNGATLSLIASNSANPEGITNGTATDLYLSALAVPQTTLALTDRLAVRIYVNNSGRTIKLHTENSHLCEVITTFSTGLTALNGLTAQVQNFATGTSGTDFGISSATSTHTFNLPTASAANRGALSSADWTTFNDKQAALVSGTNIKTINSTSVLGSGDIAVQPTLVSATNIKTINGNSVLGSGDLVVSGSSTNIYNTDGSLTAARTLTLNSFALTILGTTSSRFFANGNVGIGTTTDSGYKFDVNGNARLTGALFCQSTATVGGTTIVANAIMQVNGTNKYVNYNASYLSGSFYTYQAFGAWEAIGADAAAGTILSFGGYRSSQWTGITFHSNGSERMRVAPTTGNVLIGTTTDAGFKLDVNGTARVVSDANISGFTVGRGGGLVVGNTAVGFEAALNNTTGYITAFGYQAGKANTTGSDNVAFGYGSLRTASTANFCLAFGTFALRDNTASNNVAIGTPALLSNTTGSQNCGVGNNSLRLNLTGSNNTAVGNASLRSTTSSNNVAIGFEAGYNGDVNANTTGSNNIFVGYQSIGVSATESNRTWVGNSTTTTTWLGGSLLIGTTTDVASSICTLASTTKGFLPPRMTTTQKNAISSPAAGLVVYDTTLGKLCVRGAAAWETITSL